MVELKKAQPLTTQELAARHQVTPNAIRRHLKELEAERLVEYGREQRGHGAPTYAYSLTDAGEGLFPKSYEETLTAVLTYLERNGGREEVRRFFEQRFRAKADQIMAECGEGSLQQRVAAVAAFLSREGFMADWSLESGELKIAERNCAMHAVAARFPEICDSELSFLQELLGAELERQQHIVSGCNSCEYSINVGEREGLPVVRPHRSTDEVD
jgi:DeoR family suf operon transcriptional repressor